jgi:hypothetical protein
VTSRPDAAEDPDSARARNFLRESWRALQGESAAIESVEITGYGCGELPSVFSVSDLAAASVSAAGAALAELLRAAGHDSPTVAVDRRLASLWFGWSMRPAGWALPAAWDAIAGDYASCDGWIRLHTNAAHHRAAALAVLGVPADRSAVQREVARWSGDALEAEVVARGGCAAVMRSAEAWRQHAQGRCVHGEPLLSYSDTADADSLGWRPGGERPLQGLRVLDLTRVLAGPVATRLLAGFGADVLRIDPPQWDEPGVAVEVNLGKRCARLDLHERSDRTSFAALLGQAHVLVHGYRADALERLGFGADERRRLRPGLIDVCLNAYGWSGPWRDRRGFDSLVQMSVGIAEAGMRLLGKDRPTPLPVQALDHTTGYLIAAAVIRGLARRLCTGHGFEARASLAGTAELLMRGPPGRASSEFPAANDHEWSTEIEATAFGPAQRLRPPLRIGTQSMRWKLPAAALGSSAARW